MEIGSHFIHKMSKILRSFDYQISKNLSTCEIPTRVSSSNGLWCHFLLPLVLLLYTNLYQVPALYQLIAYVSIGLVAYSILFTLFLSVSCLVLKEAQCGGCIAASTVATLCVYSFTHNDLLYSIGCSISAVYVYSYLLRLLLTTFPKTFTIGESMIVAQSITLIGFVIIANFFGSKDASSVDNEWYFINTVVCTVLSTMGLIVTAMYLMTEEQRNIEQFLKVLLVIGVLVHLLVHSMFGTNIIFHTIWFMFMNENRLKLVILWAFLVLCSVAVLYLRSDINAKASTVARKVFHVLASLVFLTGYLVDIQLLKLCAGVGFSLLILIEAIRISKIRPISSYLELSFKVFSDEKDSGGFAMSAIYLYMGLACPLLLVPAHAHYELELLSGVLSIGVGDTAASWFGYRYGANKWPGSSKTYEGTIFNALSQVSVVYALRLLHILDSPYLLTRTTIAAVVSSYVEAKTDQVDNLVLPLITIITLQCTNYLL